MVVGDGPRAVPHELPPISSHAAQAPHRISRRLAAWLLRLPLKGGVIEEASMPSWRRRWKQPIRPQGGSDFIEALYRELEYGLVADGFGQDAFFF